MSCSACGDRGVIHDPQSDRPHDMREIPGPLITCPKCRGHIDFERHILDMPTMPGQSTVWKSWLELVHIKKLLRNNGYAERLDDYGSTLIAVSRLLDEKRARAQTILKPAETAKTAVEVVQHYLGDQRVRTGAECAVLALAEYIDERVK